MAVELASAYVSLIPSFKGGARAIGDELGGAAAKAGADAGDKAAAGFERSFGSKFRDSAAKAGIAASAALTAGFAKSLDIGKGSDKLAAQLGLTAEQSKAAGKTAADLYGNAFGDNLDQVNEAVSAVARNITGAAAIGTPAFEGLTEKVINLSSAFDQDLGGTTAAVSQLMKTGLAANADEAMDILTVGFQKGADKAGDLLDTFNEYGTQFRKLGIDGKTAVGLLTQGLAAGARDSDVVADAIKEFSIRAVDGSKTTAEGFKAIGLNAEDMAAKIAKGGPTAAAALDQTLDRIRAMKDPVAQSAAAVALFGTQAEDLGGALYAIDPSAAVANLGEVSGAANRMGDTLNDNTAGKLESFKRKAELAFAGVGAAAGPVLAVAPGLAGLMDITGGLGGVLSGVGSAAGGAVRGIGTGAAALGGWVKAAGEATASGVATAISKVGGLASSAASGIANGAGALASWVKQAAIATVETARQTVAMVAQRVAMVAQAVAAKISAAAQWLLNAAMAANPITLVVIAVVALVAILVLAYIKVGWFRDMVDAAFRWIAGVVMTVVGWIRDNWTSLLAILVGPIGLAVQFISQHFAAIKAAASDAIGWIRDRLQAVIDTARRVGDAFRDGFTTAANFVRGAVNAIIRAWNALDVSINVDVPSWVPVLGGHGWHVTDLFPDIPELADGAIVRAQPGGTIARIAEAGHDEAVVPLDGRHGLGSNITINLTINNPVGEAAPESLHRGMQKLARHGLLPVEAWAANG